MLDEETIQRLTHQGRDFTRGTGESLRYMDEYETDQERRLPQPPLFKAAVTPKEEHISLSQDFSALLLKNDLYSLFRDRKSCRAFTDKEFSLEELSFLLWATQGVKDIRGNGYAAFRPVPSGGARHEYETYLIVRNVMGLTAGVWHYLPQEHAVEFIKELQESEKDIEDSLYGQKWTARANVIFYWSMVAYRQEWRYGFFGHRVALIDAGHIGQNLYLACTGLGLGTCGVGAIDQKTCNRIFDLDGEEEYVVYAAPVGTIRERDKKESQAFFPLEEKDDKDTSARFKGDRK